MLGTYFYNEIIRKTIISFGTLFNNIYIKHNDDDDGSAKSIIKVPISYGPIQKFLARLEQKPDLRKRQAITLPRMSFELTSIQYDNSRKVSTMQTFRAVRPEGGDQVKVYMPVPYNLGIQLSIITKYNDDMLQIVEQILPFFQPQFNLTIDLVSSIGEKRDIPMILENIQMNDNYESDFSERRNLIYTLNFTAKTYMFGPIAESTEGLIKKVQVDYYTNTNTNNASRQLRYTVTPRAIQDYDNDQSAVVTKDIDLNVTTIRVSTTTPFSLNSYIMINDEEMLIKGISTNELTVERAQDGTIASKHTSGSYVNALTQVDNDLIGPDDDFGFNEERFDFGDGKIWSSTKNTDVQI
jgi:hypothetical protein